MKIIPKAGEIVLNIVRDNVSYLLFRSYSPEQVAVTTATTVVRMNLVSEETLTRKKGEAVAAWERAQALKTEAVVKGLDAEQLQLKEENLGFQADELDEAVVDMEWEETLLVPKVAALQRRHDRYL